MKYNIYGHIYNIEAYKTSYINNGTLAIVLETEDHEPFANLTVNIESKGADGTHAFVDINNLPTAEKFIADNGLGKPTGEIGFSGWCSYPLYEFDLSKLKEL